jgi:riboflavin biosynthesis pyrimidine reductase
VLKKSEPPLNVIVAGSGIVDLQKAVFQTPGVRTLIVTSPDGRERLESNGLEWLASVEARVLDNPDGRISPISILQLLRDEFAVKHLLHEGGPALFGDFLTHCCVDELFLTVAPQFAGRNLKRQRPGVISGTEFAPETAPWSKIVSVKQSGDHLYLRYALLHRNR